MLIVILIHFLYCMSIFTCYLSTPLRVAEHVGVPCQFYMCMPSGVKFWSQRQLFTDFGDKYVKQVILLIKEHKIVV